MKIDLLFPTPVFETCDDADFCNRKLLQDACLEISRRKEVINRTKNSFHRVNTSHLVSDSLHLNDEFLPLVSFIQKCSKSFLVSLGFPSWTLEITQMWTNVGEKGNFVYPHTHRGEAFMAGVFYVKCDERDGITFHNSQERMPPEVLNTLNYSTFYYDGMEGRLLLFRAETSHSTFPQEGDSRIVISFNLRLKEPV